ncbi:MAG: zinc ribbon domain-containing protein [Thermoproteota archaeon]|nr:zinc ribbon domain-containing protein [Thermoproteota archaeon]
MKIFNGRAATEEYMSTHSLTFSTPEMTLKKFALWLGDQVPLQGNNGQVPRLMVFLKELNDDKSDKTEFMPDVDDSFKPSGAVSEMYGKRSQDTHNTLPPAQPEAISKSCIQCNHILKIDSRFCPKCGSKQTT